MLRADIVNVALPADTGPVSHFADEIAVAAEYATFS